MFRGLEFPPIYDNDVNCEDLVEVSSLSYDQEVDQNLDTHHVFDFSPRSEVSYLDLEEINFVDFLGVENFLSSFPSQIFYVGFDMLEENLIFSWPEIIDSFWEIL
jgi:hypothetical protein